MKFNRTRDLLAKRVISKHEYDERDAALKEARAALALDAVALHFMYYNFGRIHKTLRVTPATEAGVSDHVWTRNCRACEFKLRHYRQLVQLDNVVAVTETVAPAVLNHFNRLRAAIISAG